MISAIKRAEDDGAGVVVRAYESAGAAVHARLELPFADQTIEADFGAFENKTFLLPTNLGAPVIEVDLLELAAE